MKILVAGMGRCGSTLIYNILRLALEDVYCCFFSKYKKNKKGNKNEVVKIHEYEEKWKDWADKIIVPRRDLRECVASMKRYKHKKRTTNENIIRYANRFYEWDSGWNSVDKKIMYYEDYIYNPMNYIKDIMMFCEYNQYNANIILDKMNNIKNTYKGKGFSSNDLLFKNHITSGKIDEYKKTLSKQQITYIEKKYKEWLINNGYTL